jgi:hypothetical protein
MIINYSTPLDTGGVAWHKDISARFVTHIRFGLHHGNIQWTVIIRALLLPLMIFCAASQTPAGNVKTKNKGKGQN